MSSNTDSPRIEPLTRDQWTEEQHKVFDPIAESKGAFNVLGTFAHHWPAFVAFSAFGQHVLGSGSTLTPRQRELAILRTAWTCDAEYEWAQHKPMARNAGIDDDEIERVKKGGGAEGWSGAEAALLDAVDDLVRDKDVSDPVWDRLTGELTTEQVFDLIYCVGQYVTVAMLAKSCRVQIDPGFSGF